MPSMQVQNAIENLDCIKNTLRRSRPLEAVAYVSGIKLMQHLVALQRELCMAAWEVLEHAKDRF
jgi:hypothetical protein